MMTNILLGLILGVVITSFVILNNKLFNIIQILGKITDAELNLNTNMVETLKLFNKLVDRFNNRILKDEEHYNNIITLLKSRFKDLDNATDSIYDRFNTIHADIEKYIAAEHIITRRQIEKQAKISSKIKTNSKTKKAKAHDRKCE